MTSNYHTPYSTNDALNAALLNAPLAELDSNITDIVSGALPILGAGVGVKLNGAAQSIPNDTLTILTFASFSALYDTDAFYNFGASSSRLTIPAGLGGKYLVFAEYGFTANATGDRKTQIIKNGGTTLAQSGGKGTTNTSGFSGSRLPAMIVADLAAADYIELRAYQDSGGALNTVAQVLFGLQRLG